MNARVVIVMGVSGSGKSTVGALLAERLSLPFVEADTFHDPKAIYQMSQGRALTSAQRRDWLVRVHAELVRLAPGGVVCACSALTSAARDQLVAGLPEARFVWLHGSPDVLGQRLSQRVGHPVGASLLSSQLNTLEPPTEALRLDVRLGPDDLVDEIVAWLSGAPEPPSQPGRKMETAIEAVARLRSVGYQHDLTVAAGGRFRCDSCGTLNDAIDMTVNETVRFEGDSNPDDQSIIVALTTGCGHLALYFSAYGPSATREDAEVHRALAATRR